MHAKEAAAFLRAFGDGTRLRILHALTVRPLTVGELARVLKAPIPRLSRHLRYLDARGLVAWQSSGRSVLYRLTPPRNRLHRRVMRAVQECMSDIIETEGDRSRLPRTR